MKPIRKIAAILTLAALLPWSISAQVEKITDATYRDRGWTFTARPILT